MSAAPTLAPVAQAAPRRSFPRYPIDVPIDVITLRSGIPESVPGRCTDISESGVGADVAGDLATGQQVAIELRLPNFGVPVRTRTLVRHHDRFHCGLQFVGLSTEQREMIRYWARVAGLTPAPKDGEHTQVSEQRLDRVIVSPKAPVVKIRFIHGRRFHALLLGIVSLGLLGWWQWQHAWNELEAPASTATELQSPLRVLPGVMERQIVYKVDPIYPESARVTGTQGLVVLDVVIATDGTVRTLRPVAGPDVLVGPAVRAVRSWRFEPYRSAGQAIEVETTLGVDFQLK